MAYECVGNSQLCVWHQHGVEWHYFVNPMVRLQFLCKAGYSHKKDPATSQTVSCQPLTAEARGWLEICPCGICGRKGARVTFIFRAFRYFPVLIIPPVLQ
jgi:hypothetical protein